MSDTYTTLGKELHLIPKGYGKYDIHIQAEDFIIREDILALEAACRVKLLTAYNELSYNPIYKNWGNHTHEYIKDNKTQLTLVKIREATIQALREMRRVKSVDLVEVTTDSENPYIVNVFFGVTSINDDMISGGLTYDNRSV